MAKTLTMTKVEPTTVDDDPAVVEAVASRASASEMLRERRAGSQLDRGDLGGEVGRCVLGVLPRLR